MAYIAERQNTFPVLGKKQIKDRNPMGFQGIPGIFPGMTVTLLKGVFLL